MRLSSIFYYWVTPSLPKNKYTTFMILKISKSPIMNTRRTYYTKTINDIKDTNDIKALVRENTGPLVFHECYPIMFINIFP